MPTDSDDNRSLDPQEALRDIIINAREYVSLPKMVLLCEAAGYGSPVGARTLDNFIRKDVSARLTQANFEALAAFWLHSPIGRALRFVDPAARPSFDEMMKCLASGNLGSPEEANAAGRYFMYHGSYLHEDCYVVRVIEIQCADDHLLTVTDTIYDNISVPPRTRTASGALMFAEGRPQILLHGKENKRGLSLIIGTEPDTHNKTLNTISGALIVMTKNNTVAYRPCLIIRENRLPSKAAMMKQSGIFTLDEIATKKRLQHRKAFDMLARHLPAQAFQDPILKYIPSRN